MRVMWTSWSPLEAAFELERIKGLPLKHQWFNGHLIRPQPNDIWLTTNGYLHRPGLFKKMTWYAESYTYLKGEYDRYASDKKWDKRFHFNPNYYKQPKSEQLPIACWWKQEKQLFDKLINTKKPTHIFGMVLGKKPTTPSHKSEFGYFRSKVVEECRNRSFIYYGTSWDKSDKNYKGETYVNGNRNTPVKFNDARILMKDVKFVFCLENTHDQHYSVNYLTEKIFHGFLSASIPIYCGCWNVHELIDPSLFIDIRKYDYDLKKVCDFCEKMPETDYLGYIDRIRKFLEKEANKFSCDERFIELDGKL